MRSAGTESTCVQRIETLEITSQGSIELQEQSCLRAPVDEDHVPYGFVVNVRTDILAPVTCLRALQRLAR